VWGREREEGGGRGGDFSLFFFGFFFGELGYATVMASVVFAVISTRRIHLKSVD